MSSVPLDAFLLYNGAEPLVSIIDARLTKRGISTWFSERSLRGTGAGAPTFESESTPREQEVLDQARVGVVFLGAAGWGPVHQQNTKYAVTHEKPLIRVLVGEPSAEAREFLGLFREKPVLEIRSANDEAAVDALAEAIRNGKEPQRTVFSNQPLRAKPVVDAERFRRALLEGEWDDQQEALDELAAIRQTHDLSALAGVLLQNLPAFVPLPSPNSPPSRAAAVLLAALVYTYDSGRADASAIAGLLAEHTNVQTQPDPNVRWEVRAAMLRAGGERFSVDWTGDPDKEVDPLCIRQRDPQLFEQMLQTYLQSQQWVSAAPFLSAFGVAPIPALVPDICATITVGDSHTLNVFGALTQPEIVAAAAAQLQTLPGADKVAELAVPVASGSGRYLMHRLASLLSRLERPRVQAVLARANCLPLLEALTELSGRLRIAGYCSDTTTNRTDALGIDTEVQTLCAVMLSTDVEPPLSIGLFGDWGSGKSFFMDRMYEEVRRMARAAPAGTQAKFHSRVAQIKFNAWHYIDSNLWASLVSHIIEELAKQVKPEEDPAVTRKELVSKLETAKELKEEAIQEKKRAEDARAAAEIQLSAVTRDRADRQVKLDDLKATDYWKLVQDDPELKAALESASRELGLPRALASFDDLQEALLDAQRLVGRAKALASSILKRPLLLLLIVVLLFGVPAATWVLNHWIPPELSALVARVGAVVAAGAAAVRWPLRAASRALDQLERARQKAANLIEQKKQEKSGLEIGLEKEVNELRAKEASATQQLTAAEAKIQEIQSKIEEIEEGRSLAKYLLQRFQAEDYRKYLGLVSTIRRDFEKLSQLLRSAEKEPVQRIILYIDDLDRCPAPRVMDVLQAVHLLLAFELFVVVVGVDPRWLLHSLEKSYTAFQKKGRKEAQSWITTPQNYLEKIFQIPFSLRPMEAAGYSKLMRSLLPVTAETREAVSGIAASPAPAQLAAAQMAVAAGAVAGGAGSPAQMAAGETSGVPAAESARPATTLEPPSLDYDALLIQPWEAEFAERLFAFMPSPRAAKRFSNTYRLLKAPLSGERLKKFEGIDAATGDFRAAMILLAVLTGFPDSASAVFGKVLENGANGLSAASLFGDAANCMVSPDRERFQKCIAPFLAGGLPDRLEIFAEWLPRVARFSFAAAKVGN